MTPVRQQSGQNDNTVAWIQMPAAPGVSDYKTPIADTCTHLTSS